MPAYPNPAIPRLIKFQYAFILQKYFASPLVFSAIIKPLAIFTTDQLPNTIMAFLVSRFRDRLMLSLKSFCACAFIINDAITITRNIFFIPVITYTTLIWFMWFET